jgi:rod shape-determining protein MreC
MENFFTRYKNPVVLVSVLIIQVIALATQIRRPEPGRPAGAGGGTRLIRVWTITAATPFEQALVATGHFFRNTWHSYLDLHDVRRQNRELQREIDRMRLEQARLRNDAEQSRRLQALLDFKQRYAGVTVAAQVIGSSGNEQSHVIYIDKGSRAGIRQDMAVITPDGIVGKVRDVYPFSSQVLMINDRDSGAGVILVNSRLQGILRGKDLGEIRVNDILADEDDKVEKGEQVITSGGDRIYPKGLPVGTVDVAKADAETTPFLLITIKPAANLNRLEEVLVVTRITEEAPAADGGEPAHHADEMPAERLASAPKKPEEKKPEEKRAQDKKPEAKASIPAATSTPNRQAASEEKPDPSVSSLQKKKPAENVSQPPQGPQAQAPAHEAEKPPR